MVKRLFFDTETTGLPYFPLPPSKDYKKYNRCRIVEIAWVVTEGNDGKIISEKRFLVSPNNWVIPVEISKIHGISQEMVKEEGISIDKVFDELLKDLEGVKWLVAHNTPFDVYVTKAEFHRYKRDKLVKRFEECKKYCTLVKSRCIWPGQKNNLSSVFERLFEYKFEGAHTALEDTKACKDVFFKIRKMKNQN